MRCHPSPLSSLFLFFGLACGNVDENASAQSDSAEASGSASGASSAPTVADASVSGDSTSDSGDATTDFTDSDGDSSSDESGAPSTSAVSLGTAANFTILAKTGISNVPPTAIEGDIGLSPAAATYLTGFSLIADATNRFSTSTQVTGRVYASDYDPPTPASMTTAVLDMELAFTEAAGLAPDVIELGAGDIGGMVLDPGVYAWGTGLLIPTDVTLEGSATDVWVFQIAGDLTVANGQSVLLMGGALPENVFWQVSGLVDLGTTAHCEGTVLTMTSARLGTGASIDGRLLAQTAVTLDGNTVVGPIQ
jgi:hypothetical protein